MPIVPVIDLAPWSQRDPDARAGVAVAVDEALRTVGFMQVVGHGIPDDTIAAMVRASDAFFELPLDRKLAARPHDLTVNRGYAAAGTEARSHTSLPG